MRMYIHNFTSSRGRKFAFTPRPVTIPNSLKAPRPIMPCFRVPSTQYQKNGLSPRRERLPRKRMSFCKARPRLLAVSRLTLSRQILSKSTPMPRNHLLYEEKSFFRSDESKFKYLDERMNDVYKAVHFLLSPAQFQKVKQGQIAWLKQRDATKTMAEKSELTQQRIKVLQGLAWPGKKELKEEQ